MNVFNPRGPAGEARRRSPHAGAPALRWRERAGESKEATEFTRFMSMPRLIGDAYIGDAESGERGSRVERSQSIRAG